VGLIPFKVNALTKSVNPIKLREYLAAGLPVVSTPLPEVIGYGYGAKIASTPEHLVAHVLSWTAEGCTGRSERSLAIREETWRRKVEAVCRHLADRPGRLRRSGQP